MFYPHGGWMWEVMERQIQRLKDRTESSDDDLFPCVETKEGKKCAGWSMYVKNWINVFFLHHQPDYITFSESEGTQKSLGDVLR
jgi:hypothetical protein